MSRYRFALLATLALVGAEATSGGAAVAGASCAAEIQHYQAIVTSDRDTGNLDQSVFDQIELELSRASAACTAGKDGEANAIVSASKHRHGYRA